jgi:hypothetical protein
MQATASDAAAGDPLRPFLAASLSAADPLAPMAKVDALRGVHCDRRDALSRHAEDRAKGECKAQVSQRLFRAGVHFGRDSPRGGQD